MASVAIRYARAFAGAVVDLKLDPEQVREELRSLVRLVSANADLRHVWESPAVTQEEKVRLLDAIAERAGFHAAVRNFMAVVMEHGRASALPAIARQFEKELDRRLGFVEAAVTSARDLSVEEKSAMEAQIGRLTGQKVRAHYERDQNLLGGALVKIGSMIYDGSLRGQLRRIKEQLSAE
jgi:F-type H+-transporting ATPase subunit delta